MKPSTKKVLIISGIFIVLISVGVYIAQQDNVVQIKYFGNKVDLSEYDSLDTSKSSFVEGAWYDTSGNTLVLKLNNDYYQYCDIPENIWSDFSNAESFGTYYNTTIKDHYQCSSSNNSLSENETSDSVNDIESSPYYETCLSEAAEKGNVFLSSHGYTENEDGSWTDVNGDYPTSDFENNELEKYQTEVLFDCLENHE